MADRDRVALIAEAVGEQTVLLSPGVGWFTRARPAGELLSEGSDAGVLTTLGHARHLVVPAGIAGRVENRPGPAVRRPVGYRDELYRLSPLAAGAASETAAATEPDRAEGLVFESPQSGRFYLAPSPGEPPFVQVGDSVAAGTTIGLLEIMKTFTQVVYRPGDGLPATAKIEAILVADGDEVSPGQPLLSLGSS